MVIQRTGRIGRLAGVAAAISLGLLNLAASPAGDWVGAWASAQQVPEDINALPADDLADATLRQVVRLSAGGSRIRIRLSNAFGTAPLRFGAVHVAKPRTPGSPQTDPATDRTVTFGGRPDVVVPAGADYLSDPIALPVRALDRLTVSLHLPVTPARQTSHPGSRTTSWVAKGDRTAAADLPGAKAVEHWYQLAAIEVAAGPQAAAIVAFGDSITDGHGATTNRDDRWPDILAERLQANPATRRFSVLNQGIGGNRLLLDGLGPNALARFDRDVLAQPGVTHVIVLEGVNDMGVLTRDQPASPEAHAQLVRDITGAYAQMVARAHAKGIKAIGATILPYAGSGYYHPGRESEADRQAVNAWIRAPGRFDAVVDFDALTRDPADPKRLRKDYDSGDGLHPSPAGYRAMGDAAYAVIAR
jgi:lysophospholipase L1-like esterase